jgi:hypothetical protein
MGDLQVRVLDVFAANEQVLYIKNKVKKKSIVLARCFRVRWV